MEEAHQPRTWHVTSGPPAHDYLSTACFHNVHGECRLECKFCAAPCRCSCHRMTPVREPRNPMPRVRSGRSPRDPAREVSVWLDSLPVEFGLIGPGA